MPRPLRIEYENAYYHVQYYGKGNVMLYLGSEVFRAWAYSQRITDDKGQEQQLTLDDTFTPTLGLLHEDYIERAVPLLESPESLLWVYLVSPIDLALSKLVRFADHDREDIIALANANCITAQTLNKQADDALPGYIGNVDMLKINIQEAIESISG